MCADLQRGDECGGSKGREKGQNSTALRRGDQQDDVPEGTGDEANGRKRSHS